MLDIIYPDESDTLHHQAIDLVMLQIDESNSFRVVFLMCGIGQHLLNLEALSEDNCVGRMDGRLLPCWHRLFDSGYRASKEDIELFRTVALMDVDVTRDILNNFMTWYHKYIQPNFFGTCKYLRYYEQN